MYFFMNQRVRLISAIIAILIAVVSYCYFYIYSIKDASRVKNCSTWRLTDTLDYSASIPMHPTFEQALLQSSYSMYKEAAEYDDANLIFFETFNSIDTLMSQVKWPANDADCIVYGMAGSDCLASKGLLAHHMRRAGFSEYLPPTFILCMHNDVAALVKYAAANPDAVYIMKKNIQRQEGCFVTAHMTHVIKMRHEYVVAQAILQDPLVVGGRKINLRIYLLVVIKGGRECKLYRYTDGFMYYTPKRFVPYTTDTDHIITTGYIDRSVYEENPLTYKDLAGHLGDARARVLDENISIMCASINKCFGQMLLTYNKDMPDRHTRACIFGMDVAPDSQLGCKIMEINKGPDLAFKDERDKSVKLGMVANMFDMLFDGGRKTTGFQECV